MPQQDPPRWELDKLLPDAGTAPAEAALQNLQRQLAALEDHYTRHDIVPGPPINITEETVHLFDSTLTLLSNLVEDRRNLIFYWAGRCWADGNDSEAAAQQAAVSEGTGALAELVSGFHQWATRLDREELTSISSLAAAHTYWLDSAEVLAQHRLPAEQELLLSQLKSSGSEAWRALHRDLTATLTGELNGQAQPLSALRSQLNSLDSAQRGAAHLALQAAWQSVETPAAACLNAIRGETLALSRARRWDRPLAISLNDNGIDSSILQLVHEAVEASLPALRMFAKSKARLLGAGTLNYWDIQAPLPDEPTVSWHQALNIVTQAASSLSPEFSALVERAAENRWIDAQLRPRKRQTALTMPVQSGESRILINFTGAMDDVLSLAHEMGHAYQYHLMYKAGPLQRIPPLALAETASLLAETLLLDAHDNTDSFLPLLNAELIGHFQVIVDTYSRYLFEREYMKRRESGPLAPTQISELLHEAQTHTYGDSVSHGSLDRFAWISKPHYYADTPFANWPYYFGLLLGFGLKSNAEKTGDWTGTLRLLADSGIQAPEPLAKSCGIDIRSADFWMSAASSLWRRAERFSEAVAALPARTQP